MGFILVFAILLIVAGGGFYAWSQSRSPATPYTRSVGGSVGPTSGGLTYFGFAVLGVLGGVSLVFLLLLVLISNYHGPLP